jgi:hypothetical protein
MVAEPTALWRARLKGQSAADDPSRRREVNIFPEEYEKGPGTLACAPGP